MRNNFLVELLIYLETNYLQIRCYQVGRKVWYVTKRDVTKQDGYSLYLNLEIKLDIIKIALKLFGTAFFSCCITKSFGCSNSFNCAFYFLKPRLPKECFAVFLDCAKMKLTRRIYLGYRQRNVHVWRVFVVLILLYENRFLFWRKSGHFPEKLWWEFSDDSALRSRKMQ